MSDKTKLYHCRGYLFCMYELLGKSTIQIVKECKVNHVTILNWLGKFNIKRRTRSEALTGEKNPMYGRTGKDHPIYGRTGAKAPFYGKHHSDKTKKLMSDRNKGKNNPSYGRTGKDHPSYGKAGENAFNWKEDAGYFAKYMWIRRHFPQKEFCDDMCEICGKFRLDLQLAQFLPNNKRNMENPMIDYMYICSNTGKNGCHRIYDTLTIKQKERLLSGTTTRQEKLERVRKIKKK